MATGKSLSEMDLKEEVLPAQGFDDLPDFGAFAPPPQPGAYRFQLPQDLSHVWEPYDSAKGQRVRMIFDRDNALLITRSPGGKMNNETFQTRLSNQERRRGQVEASDLDYLLRALGEKVRPTSNKQMIETVQQYGGREFGADITYSWQCSTTREIYVADPADASKTVKAEGVMGCGWKYYTGDKPADATKKVGYIGKEADGTFPVEISCQCGAVVRAFANIDNIRA